EREIGEGQVGRSEPRVEVERQPQVALRVVVRITAPMREREVVVCDGVVRIARGDSRELIELQRRLEALGHGPGGRGDEQDENAAGSGASHAAYLSPKDPESCARQGRSSSTRPRLGTTRLSWRFAGTLDFSEVGTPRCVAATTATRYQCVQQCVQESHHER